MGAIEMVLPGGLGEEIGGLSVCGRSSSSTSARGSSSHSASVSSRARGSSSRSTSSTRFADDTAAGAVQAEQHQLWLGVEIHHELDLPFLHVHHSLPPILTHQLHVVSPPSSRRGNTGASDSQTNLLSSLVTRGAVQGGTLEVLWWGGCCCKRCKGSKCPRGGLGTRSR